VPAPPDEAHEGKAPPSDCWLHEAVEVRASPIEGSGLFALSSLPVGTFVAQLGGRLIPDDELARLIDDAERDPERPYVDSIAVDENANLLIPAGQPIHFGNHSCDPKLWHIDAFTLAARRDITADDELTVDYASQTANPNFEMNCHCGSPVCRDMITGRDWQRAELQQRYGNHWVPALLQRIAGSAPDTT
jgi:hypothetical protein